MRKQNTNNVKNIMDVHRKNIKKEGSININLRLNNEVNSLYIQIIEYRIIELYRYTQFILKTGFVSICN